jgi:hypothetical protein
MDFFLTQAYRVMYNDILLLNDVISSYYMIKNESKLNSDGENVEKDGTGTPTRRPRSGSLR